MNERVSKEKMFLNIAKCVAQRSTCLHKKVGSVIVDVYGNVVSTGYNGAARGMEDCIERGYCNISKENCVCESVGAEQNSLIQAGKTATCADMYLYTEDVQTGEVLKSLPSLICSCMLINALISNVFIMCDNEQNYIVMTPEEIYKIQHDKLGVV